MFEGNQDLPGDYSFHFINPDQVTANHATELRSSYLAYKSGRVEIFSRTVTPRLKNRALKYGKVFQSTDYFRSNTCFLTEAGWFPGSRIRNGVCGEDGSRGIRVAWLR